MVYSWYLYGAIRYIHGIYMVLYGVIRYIREEEDLRQLVSKIFIGYSMTLYGIFMVFIWSNTVYSWYLYDAIWRYTVY